MPAKKTYRAAAIGRTGKGGYGHGLHVAYKNIESVEFLAVADPDEAGRAKGQQETGAPRAYADYQEMLRKEQPDLVSVCPRWVDCHLEMVLACLEAGAHVYCEKPMTWSLEDGDRIVAKARALNKKIAIAHQGVYLPRVQHARRLLQEGRIGQVHAFHAHGKQDKRGGGEDMLVLGTHLFNMMRFFAGDVAWMSAHVTAEGRELTLQDIREPTEPIGPVAGDCVNSYFAFESGPVGLFDSRRRQIGGGQYYGMEISGETGTLSLRGGSGGELMLYPHPVFRPADPAQQWQPVEEVPDQPLQLGNQLAILDLIVAVEEDRQPLSSARDAVAALEMILGAYESQITGQRVRFPMQQRRHPLTAWREGAYGGR